jgi:hypothetical protein
MIFDMPRGGEGGITRRCAPRPFGAALRALSPRCRCHYKLNENVENLPNAWRKGRDCSRLRRSSSASLRTVAAALQRPKSPSAILSNPLVYISGSNPLFVAVTTEGSKTSGIHWPCGGEGGIRTLDGLLTHTPLAGARLRPLGHLSGQDIGPIAERGMIPARSSPGKAKGIYSPIFGPYLGRQASSTILAAGAPIRESWSSSRLMRS